MNLDSLLGSKYVTKKDDVYVLTKPEDDNDGRDTPTSVSSEATGGGLSDVEAGEATTEHKPTVKPRAGGSGKSRPSSSHRK